MIRDFNMLVTTSRGNEKYARFELEHLLEEIGDSAPVLHRTGISGLLSLKTVLDPFEVIARFRDVLRSRPYEFRFTLRVIPVERIVRTDLKEIQTAVAELASKIDKSETFRITVEKRYTTLSSSEIIQASAAGIKREVNLSKPDKILLIEIVGGLTGVSVIRPDDVLSTLKEKVL